MFIQYCPKARPRLQTKTQKRARRNLFAGPHAPEQMMKIELRPQTWFGLPLRISFPQRREKVVQLLVNVFPAHHRLGDFSADQPTVSLP